MSKKCSSSVPSLSTLCLQKISIKIEKYPATAFSMLSDLQWEKILQFRHEMTKPKTAGGGRGGLDGSGRMAPAISAKLLEETEKENEHLRNSQVADELVWKDCVAYKFKLNGSSRPKMLSLPWPILVKQVKETGQELLEIVSSSGRSELSCDEMKSKISDCLSRLDDFPMSVQLLSATDIGKIVSKVLKSCKRIETQKEISNESAVLVSFRERFNDLFESWKNVASESGVVVSSSQSSTVHDCTGRDKKTTVQQHKEDLNLLQSCSSWRDLYHALTERQSKVMMQHGEKMRAIRHNLENNKNKVKKAKLLQSRQPRRNHRLDNIIHKQPTKAIQVLNSASKSTRNSKFNVLRKETALAVCLQKSNPSNIKKGSMFGASVANVNAAQKRKVIDTTKDIKIKGGKKLKLPSRKTASMLHSQRVGSSKFRRLY